MPLESRRVNSNLTTKANAMHPIQITFGGNSLDEVHQHIQSYLQDHFGRPVILGSPNPTPDAAKVFAENPLPPAPSTAAVAPSPTAPEVPQASSATPPPAPSVPAAPAPAAELAQAAIPLPPAATVEVDSNGIPWDERIHSGSRKKTQKGEWAKRRGVQETLIKKVEAELRGKTPAPAPAASAAPVPSAPTAPVAAAAPLPPPPPVPQGEGLTFAQVIERVQAAISSGKWTHTTLSVKLLEIGANRLEELATRPDILATFAKEIPAI